MKKSKILSILEVVKFVLVFVLLLMFINFNAQIAKQTEKTNELAASTNDVVKGQADILQAIRQVTEDTRITASQQTAIIICMLQVPIEQRTKDLQSQCRSRAVDEAHDNTLSSSKSSGHTIHSSLNSTPKAKPTQRDKPQSDEPKQDKALVPRVLDSVTGTVNNLIEGIL